MESDLFLHLSFDYARQLRYYLLETAARKALNGEFVPDGVYYFLGILVAEHEKNFVTSEDENSKESV